MTLSHGCAVVDTTLHLDHEPVTKSRLLEEQERFRIGQVVDRRIGLDRIGCKKNWLGSETADIFLSRPMTTWLGEVLAKELTAAGLQPAVTTEERAILVDVELLHFFTEPDMGFFGIAIYAIVHAQVKVTFPDGASYARRFAFSDFKSYFTQADGNYREVLEQVLDSWLAQVVPAVVELVKAHRANRLQASPDWRRLA